MPNGAVKYRENEAILNTNQLLARGMPYVGHSPGWTKEVKASDLSPYKPRRVKKYQ